MAHRLPQRTMLSKMLFRKHMHYLKPSLVRLAIFPLFLITFPIEARPSPCEPNDPDGENPGNLCLTYPTHGLSINSNSFRQGFATDGFYGTAVGPNQPGDKIIPNHQPRTPMDLNRGRPGFWTSIQAQNEQTRVQTNTGRQWLLQLKR